MNTSEIGFIKNNYIQNIVNSRPYFTRMIYDSYRKLNNNLPIENEDCVANNDFYITMDEYYKGQNYEEIEKEFELINKNLPSQNENAQIKENLNDLDITNANFLKPEDIPKRVFNKEVPSSMDSSNRYNFKSKNKKIISFISSANIKQNKISDYINQVYNYNNFDNTNYIKVIDKNNKILLLEKMITYENNSIKYAMDINSIKHKAELLVAPRLRFIEKVTTIITKFIIALKKLYNARKEKAKNKENKELNHTYSLTSFNRENNNSPNESEKFEQQDEKLKKVNEVISIEPIKMIYKSPENKRNKKKNINSIKKLLQQKKQDKDTATNKIFLSSIKNKMKFYDKQDEIFISEKVKKSSNKISSERYNNSNHKEDNFNHNTKIQKIEKKQDEEKYICPQKKLNYSSLKLYISQELTKK